MNYLLRDRVLFALLALPLHESKALTNLLDVIAAAPIHRARSSYQDRTGRVGYLYVSTRWEIYYFVSGNGQVTFSELLRVSLPPD